MPIAHDIGHTTASRPPWHSRFNSCSTNSSSQWSFCEYGGFSNPLFNITGWLFVSFKLLNFAIVSLLKQSPCTIFDFPSFLIIILANANVCISESCSIPYKLFFRIYSISSGAEACLNIVPIAVTRKVPEPQQISITFEFLSIFINSAINSVRCGGVSTIPSELPSPEE